MDDKLNIRIYFELEARQGGHIQIFAGEEDLYLDLNPTREEIRKVIADLKNQLKKFPIKGQKSRNRLKILKPFPCFLQQQFLRR